MKIGRYRSGDGREGVVVFTEDAAIDFSRALEDYQLNTGIEGRNYTSIQAMLDDGVFTVSFVEPVVKWVEDRLSRGFDYLALNDYRLLAPIERPPTIYALGRNFPSHAIEHAGRISEEPIVFAKASGSVIGPEEPIIYKKFLTRVDPEAELAVIIGRRGSNISEEEAESFIAGYTILNDVTARDMQSADIAVSHPWFRSKSIDTFCPMGPFVVLPDEIKEPVELNIELWVNGEIRQKDNTRNLTFKIPYIISWLSKYLTLVPGDVIATGTPEGMKPVFPGDLIEIMIEKIGVLRNPVEAESE